MPVGSIVFWHEAASLESLKNTYPTDWQNRVEEFTIGTNRTVFVPKGWLPCYGNIVNENIMAPNFGSVDGIEPYYFAATPVNHRGPDKMNTNYVKLRNTDIPNHYHKIDFTVTAELGKHTHRISGGEHAHIIATGDAGHNCGRGSNWDASTVRYDDGDYRYTHYGALPRNKWKGGTSADVFVNMLGKLVKGHEHVCESAGATTSIEIKDSTTSKINNATPDSSMMTQTTAVDKKPATAYVIPIMKYRNIL